MLGRDCRFLQGAETDPDVVETIRGALEAREEVQVMLLRPLVRSAVRPS